jgi:EAL domain-containing protein (putative c-di-GMP-specific phosphodiesterase class I)
MRSQPLSGRSAYPARQMKEAIQGLIAREALHTLFQPIIDGATREPIGYAALTRGPEGSPTSCSSS